MARKSRRRPPVRTRPVAAGDAPVAPPSTTATGGGSSAMVRAVEMSLSGRPQPRRGSGRMVLDSGDPGIPLDRVPYFVPDLRRVAVVGVAMLVLLVAGSFLIPTFVK